MVVVLFCLMVFNGTFNNISVISWRSVLLVEETGGPEENQRTTCRKSLTVQPIKNQWNQIFSIFSYLV
jgi:hypothetical protein